MLLAAGGRGKGKVGTSICRGHAGPQTADGPGAVTSGVAACAPAETGTTGTLAVVSALLPYAMRINLSRWRSISWLDNRGVRLLEELAGFR